MQGSWDVQAGPTETMGVAMAGGTTTLEGGADRSNGRSWALALALALGIVLVVCLVMPPVYAMGDDYVQDLYLRGGYWGVRTSLMPYSLVGFSYPVAALYLLAPAVAWFPLALLALIAGAFAYAYRMVLSSRVGRPLRLALLVAFAALEALACLYFTYTAVALLATAAGCSWVSSRWVMSRRDRICPSDLLAVLLAFEGFSLRPESGLAALMFLAPLGLWMLLRNRNARGFALVGVALALMGASFCLTRLAYASTPGWETFSQDFSKAQAIVDYTRIDDQVAREAAPQLSSNDLDMLYYFQFVDSNVFDRATMEALDGVVPSYGLSSLVSAVTGRKAITAFLALVLVLLYATAVVLARAQRAPGDVRAAMLGVPTTALLFLAVVYLRNRLKMQVFMPLPASCLMVLVACLAPGAGRAGARGGAPGAHARPSAEADAPGSAKAALALGLSFCLVAGLVCLAYVRPVRRQVQEPVTQRSLQYLEDHQDELILFNYSQTALTNTDAFAFDSWDVPENAALVGSYEEYSSPWREWLARHGYSLDGFLGYLVQGTPDGRQVRAVATDRMAQCLQTYLQEHYAQGATVTRSSLEDLGEWPAVSGNLYVWSFSLS